MQHIESTSILPSGSNQLRVRCVMPTFFPRPSSEAKLTDLRSEEETLPSTVSLDFTVLHAVPGKLIKSSKLNNMWTGPHDTPRLVGHLIPKIRKISNENARTLALVAYKLDYDVDHFVLTLGAGCGLFAQSSHLLCCLGFRVRHTQRFEIEPNAKMKGYGVANESSVVKIYHGEPVDLKAKLVTQLFAFCGDDTKVDADDISPGKDSPESAQGYTYRQVETLNLVTVSKETTPYSTREFTLPVNRDSSKWWKETADLLTNVLLSVNTFVFPPNGEITVSVTDDQDRLTIIVRTKNKEAHVKLRLEFSNHDYLGLDKIVVLDLERGKAVSETDTNVEVKMEGTPFEDIKSAKQVLGQHVPLLLVSGVIPLNATITNVRGETMTTSLLGKMTSKKETVQDSASFPWKESDNTFIIQIYDRNMSPFYYPKDLRATAVFELTAAKEKK